MRTLFLTLLFLALAALLPAQKAPVSAESQAPQAPKVDDPAPIPTPYPKAAAPVKPEPTPAPHELKGVRVRPSADSLRLIFMLDRATPYNVREDLENGRVLLQLINAHVGYLPAELSRLNDPRLSGVWLKQQDPGLLTLELRLPSPKARIEHFALDDPASIVIDLYRTDQPAHVATAPELSVTPSAAPPAVPPAVISPTPTPAQTPPERPLKGTRGSVLPMDDAPVPPPAVMTPTPTPTPRPATSTPVAHAVATPDADATASQARAQSQLLDMDYDYFPVHAILVSSPLVKDIREDFLGRRWATVIEKGLKFLQAHRLDLEAKHVLYLMAEARWQSGNPMEFPPFQDMLNYYQQANRTLSTGALGTFAQWRMGQIYNRINASEEALDCFNRALESPEAALRQRAAMFKIGMLNQLKRYDNALALITLLDGQTSSTTTRVDLAIIEGTTRLENADAPGAWAAFERAFKLDPKWMSLDLQGTENMARAAMETGHLDKAREAIEFINSNFSHHSGDEEVRLALLYADILSRQGDTKTAEEIYATLLANTKAKKTITQVQQRMLKLHRNEIMQGEDRYCLILWRQGKIRAAMAELDRVYRQCVSEGVTTAPLIPLIETILPGFIEHAVTTRQPFEAVQAWKMYGYALAGKPAETHAHTPLAQALENIGLNDEALKMLARCKEELPTTATLQRTDLKMQEARLLIKTGQPTAAIPLLESLLAETQDPARTQAINDCLAQSYLNTNQKLEAAQAYQILANAPSADMPTRGQAILAAGEIFLAKDMPLQTIELCLEGLIYEKQQLEKKPDENWDDTTGNALRLMLARAYQARGDRDRERIILDDFLARPAITAEDKAQALLMLGDSQQFAGKPDQALQSFQSITSDKAAPDLWKRTAGETQKMINWNALHPQWAIELTTATLSGQDAHKR